MNQDGFVRRLTITSGQLATKLGISDPTLRKKLPALYAAGLPQKLPGLNSWSEPAVDRWLETYGTTAPIEPARNLALEDATRVLEERYAEAS